MYKRQAGIQRGLRPMVGHSVDAQSRPLLKILHCGHGFAVVSGVNIFAAQIAQLVEPLLQFLDRAAAAAVFQGLIGRARSVFGIQRDLRFAAGRSIHFKPGLFLKRLDRIDGIAVVFGVDIFAA